MNGQSTRQGNVWHRRSPRRRSVARFFRIPGYLVTGIFIVLVVIAMPVNFADEDDLFAAKAAFAAGKGGGNSGGGGGNSGGGGDPGGGGGDPGNSGADNGDDGGGMGVGSSGGDPGKSGADNGDDGGSPDAGDAPDEGDSTADGVGSDADIAAPEPPFDEMSDDELEAYVVREEIEDGATEEAIGAPRPAGAIVLTPHEEAMMIDAGWSTAD